MPRVNTTGGSSSFPAANNLLQKKWNDRAYKLHLEKMKTTKTKLDTSKPKECPHLHLNLKKIQMEEEKQALIDRDNRILLSKLTNILRSDGLVDNWNYDYDNRPRTLNAPQMQREQERIAKENERIMKRLNKASGSYDFDKMEDDFLMHEYYKSMKSQETKAHELDARGFQEDDLQYHKRAERTEDGPIDGDEGATGDDEATAAVEGDKLPAVEETRKKPPPSRRVLRKQPTRLPLLGAERKKEEEKRKKEAVSKPSPYDEREDAAKLFKAIKGMTKAETVLIHALARRTYAQRQKTIARFTQQYELDLEDDFKGQLDDDFGDLVSALLARREELDAMALNHALKGRGSLAEAVIEILCTRNNLALGVIKNTYHRLYGVELEEDIKSEVKGQLKHLFLALAKGSRNEKMPANSDTAESDAQELLDEEADRWTANRGKLAQLLPAASYDHIRAVFQQYEKLIDWKLVQEMRGALSGDYRDAMIALVKCLNNCASFLAEQINQVLKGEADESTLIRIMVTRSEVDLLQIRRAYRKKYGALLIDSIENQCRSPIKKALIQMVLVHGVPKEDKEAQKSEPDTSKHTILPKVVASEVKTKPLRGPQPNKDATMPSDNPLVRSTRLHKSPVRRVVTPRGMNKTPSSRTSNSSRTSLRRPTKKVTTPRSGPAPRQPTKPAQARKQPPVSQTQSKSPTKSLKSTTQPKQKQVVTQQETPKSSDTSRTITSAQVKPERTQEDDNVKTEISAEGEGNMNAETQKEEVPDTAASSTKKESSSDEGISLEKASTGKDEVSDVVISSEDQISDGKDTSETEEKDTSEVEDKEKDSSEAKTNEESDGVGRKEDVENKEKEDEVRPETSGEDNKDETKGGEEEEVSAAANKGIIGGDEQQRPTTKVEE